MKAELGGERSNHRENFAGNRKQLKIDLRSKILIFSSRNAIIYFLKIKPLYQNRLKLLDTTKSQILLVT